MASAFANTKDGIGRTNTRITNIDGPITWIKCPSHGELASGGSLPDAVANCNKFIQGIVTGSPDLLRHPTETREQRIIREAKYGIAPNERD